jgi:hypothetical protein
MKISYELVFVVLALLVIFYYAREGFLPNSKEVPKCPAGSERGKNGLDCKSMGDLYGL